MLRSRPPRTPPSLPEAEWRSVQALSGLPDKARHEIERIAAEIAICKHRNPWTTALREARQSVAGARTSLRRAQANLNRLLESEAPSFMHDVRGDGSILPILQHRPKIVAALQAVTDALQVLPIGLEDKIPRSRQGNVRGSTRTAVFELNALLEKYLGRGLDQSKNMLEFARLICRKASPDLATESVRDHVRALRNARRSRGG
jgi:hypothetical protein